MRVDTLCHPPQVGGDDAHRDPCGACVESSPDEAALNKSFHRCLRAALQDRPGSGAVCFCTARLPVHWGKVLILSSPRVPQLRETATKIFRRAPRPLSGFRPPTPQSPRSVPAPQRTAARPATLLAARPTAFPAPAATTPSAIASAMLRRLRPLSNAVVATDPSTSCAASAQRLRAPVAWRSAGVVFGGSQSDAPHRVAPAATGRDSLPPRCCPLRGPARDIPRAGRGADRSLPLPDPSRRSSRPALDRLPGRRAPVTGEAARRTEPGGGRRVAHPPTALVPGHRQARQREHELRHLELSRDPELGEDVLQVRAHGAVSKRRWRP